MSLYSAYFIGVAIGFLAHPAASRICKLVSRRKQTRIRTQWTSPKSSIQEISRWN